MPVTTFSVDVTRADDTTFVKLDGELDIATVPTMRETAIAELDRPECSQLVLELADLAFLDSTGIGSWVEIRTHAVELGKRVTIRSAPEAVRRVLEIGGLLALFSEDGADGAEPQGS